ncbi:MAG: MFS transporter [Thermotogota bacterium]
MYKIEMKKNIKRGYIFSFLSNFDLTSTVWMLFLAYKGMSLTQLGLLEGIFHVTSFFMEVPTGAIADIFGRKTSRVLGRIFSVVANLFILFFNSFWFFAISMSLTAISYNLESGAGQALIYDSLKELEKENKYLKVSGKIEMLTQIGMLSGYLLGGFLANNSYTLAYSFAVIIGVLAVVQSFTFKEPSIELDVENKSIKSVFVNAYNSFKILKSKKDILYLVFFIEGILMIATTLFFYLQNYFLSIGYNQFQIGAIMAIGAMTSATMSFFTYKVEKKVGIKKMLKIFPFINAMALIGMAFSNITYVFFIIIEGIEGSLYVLYQDYVNKRIPSNKRATILSLCSMVFSFYMIFMFPLFGKVSETYSFKTSFIIIAILMTILSFINLYILSKNKK